MSPSDNSNSRIGLRVVARTEMSQQVIRSMVAVHTSRLITTKYGGKLICQIVSGRGAAQSE